MQMQMLKTQQKRTPHDNNTFVQSLLWTSIVFVGSCTVFIYDTVSLFCEDHYNPPHQITLTGEGKSVSGKIDVSQWVPTKYFNDHCQQEKFNAQSVLNVSF